MVSSIYLQPTANSHRQRPSIFDDPVTRKALFDFPMITGWILDTMHLFAGGVFKDFFKRILDAILDWQPGRAQKKSKAMAEIQNWIDVFNKTRILEVCKFRQEYI